MIAERFDASVHVIHVLEPPVVSGPWGSESHVEQLPRMREIAEREAQTRLEQVKPTGGSTEIADGNNIARTIMDLTRAREADLIVMGTHGRSGIAHALLGSVEERVIRNSSCPVLIVRAPEQSAITQSSVQARNALKAEQQRDSHHELRVELIRPVGYWWAGIVPSCHGCPGR